MSRNGCSHLYDRWTLISHIFRERDSSRGYTEARPISAAFVQPKLVVRLPSSAEAVAKRTSTSLDAEERIESASSRTGSTKPSQGSLLPELDRAGIRSPEEPARRA